jgi:hypothetical protein
MLDADQIVKKCRNLERRYRETDNIWRDVLATRRGDLDVVFPDLVSEDWPKPIISNFIDIAARDLAEVIAPLPAFNCSSTSMTSDASKKFADKRSKIAQNYVQYSHLDVQMLTGADHYLTYGMSVIYVEPDFECDLPRITIEDPMGGYPEYDRWGRCTAFTRRFYREAGVLAELYPEYAETILRLDQNLAKNPNNPNNQGENKLEVIRYCDASQITLVLVAEAPVILESVNNRLGECPVVIGHRPWVDMSKPRGQFDDVIWMQLARDTLAKLQLSAVEKTVQAPLAVPLDVQELTFGPDAVIRTNSPEKVQHVGLNLSQHSFTEEAILLDEMRTGTRYPGVRTGGTDASVITGKGVQALLGGFDSQVKAAQLVFQIAFTQVMRKCFMMDERYWPEQTKEIRGQHNGTPYELSYKPSRDIKNAYDCDVSYGFAAGLDPNRAVVLLLQLRAEKLFSKDYFARQLPFELNVTDEQTKVAVEETREALFQAIYGFVQSIPALAQSGQDPSGPVVQVAEMVKRLQNGDQVEDVCLAVFAPQSPPSGQPGPGGPAGGPGAGSPGPGGLAGMAGGGGGLSPSGLLRGVPFGQAGSAPGGRPDIKTMLAGINPSGNPSMSSYVMSRRRA